MKIKAVCEKTGLSDRTIRYYIEEKLLSPSYTENYLGRKSFDFSDENVAELNDIATLRSFDFSIDEIRALLADPHDSPAIIQRVKERVTSNLQTDQKKMVALSSLKEQTVYTVPDLARDLASSGNSTPSETAVAPKLRKRVSLLCLCILCIPICASAPLRIVAKCEHEWRDLAVEAKASCTTEGSLLQVCSVCNEIRTQVIAKLSHTEAIDTAAIPSCTRDGLTEGSHCSSCGAVIRKQEVIPKTDHSYEKSHVLATCGQDGYSVLTCSCGHSAQKNIFQATEEHCFVSNGALGFRCTGCELTVCEYGNADGSDVGGKNAVRYYITGNADSENVQERTLVIIGRGDMPDPCDAPYHPWRDSPYVEEIKSVILGKDITSIADGAFAAIHPDDRYLGNPFHSVEQFAIKNGSLSVDPKSPCVSGIECDITYLH